MESTRGRPHLPTTPLSASIPVLNIPVDYTPVVVVAPVLHLQLDVAVGWVPGSLERLWLRDGRDWVHAVRDEVSDVGAVVQVLQADGEVGVAGLVRGEDALAKERPGRRITLFELNAHPV